MLTQPVNPYCTCTIHSMTSPVLYPARYGTVPGTEDGLARGRVITPRWGDWGRHLGPFRGQQPSSDPSTAITSCGLGRLWELVGVGRGRGEERAVVGLSVRRWR